MNMLETQNNIYNFTSRKNFNALGIFKEKSVKLAFDFAYNMSFGGKGEHRDHRSGGTHRRRNGEIFINTFQGKLSEFGIYNEFWKRNFEIKSPDLDTYELGKWDEYDFNVNNKKIAVKSTKCFGQLLLLETKDWTSDGMYIPNINTENSIYDYFILVRIEAKSDTSPIVDGEKLMKSYSLLYSDSVDKNMLYSIISQFKWSYDIPGFITNNDLIYIIRNKFILPKGSSLGKYTTMDAENYYVQAGDMHNINELFILL